MRSEIPENSIVGIRIDRLYEQKKVAQVGRISTMGRSSSKKLIPQVEKAQEPCDARLIVPYALGRISVEHHLFSSLTKKYY